MDFRMHERNRWGGLPTTLLALTVTTAVAAGCTGVAENNPSGAMAGSGGSTTTTAGTGSVTAGTGMIQGGNGPITCDGSPVSDAKRIVRLSFNQISNTVHSLFGDTFGQK